MIKRTLILLLMSVLILPVQAFAAVVGQPVYDASQDRYVAEFDAPTVESVDHRHYSDAGYTNMTYQNTVDLTGGQNPGYAFYNCKTYVHDTFYDGSGNVVGEIKFYASQVQNSKCTTNYTPPADTGGGSGGSSGGCNLNSCEVFSCPNWNEYMGKVDQILAKIPSKSDLQEILGEVEDPPQPPAAPAVPPLGEDLDDGGITPPTGESAPGLDDSTFTEDDIKDQAPVIEEREDESGGFKIDNPVDSLPSQEEFTKNVPDEGDAPIPGDPKELENKAPTPTEGDNTAPTPDEGTNTAPTPSDSGATAPIPTESGTAPLPNESGIAPLPGDDGSTAPLPGG